LIAGRHARATSDIEWRLLVESGLCTLPDLV
jgi:hypothetical protein